jgi:hypothetical protein
MTSAATTAVGNVNDAPAGSVSISGIAEQNKTLTASHNLTDLDGIPTTAGAISFQWRAGGINITGATASTYTLTQAEVGKTITVTASYTDLQGAAESVTSAATTVVTNVNDAPVLTAIAPSLSSITEDAIANPGQSVASILGTSLSDVDAGAVQGLALYGAAGGNGKWQYSLNAGSSWTDVGVVSGSAALLLRATDLVRWLPDGSNGTAASISYYGWDQTSGAAGSKASAVARGGSSAFSLAGDSAVMTVQHVNDLPTGTVSLVLPTRDLVTLEFEGTNGNSIFGQGITPRGGAVISTAQKVSGNSAAYFNGSGAALAFNIPALNVGPMDFTIDFYFKTHDTQNSWSVIMSSVREGVWGEISNGTALAGALRFSNQGLVSGANFNDGGWHRATAGQKGTESYLIVDGALQGKTTSTATIHDFSDLLLGKLGGQWIGAPDNSFKGWIDDFRVSVSSTIPVQGQTLTASNSLADLDGIPTVGAGAISYQWKAGGANIAGAISSTYTLTQAEVGKDITVTLSYVDLGGSPESVTSPASAAVLPISAGPTYATPKFWKNPIQVPSEVNKAAAVNLTDAIGILKMIVGLPVNSNNVPLSPYQSIAADFDQSGEVNLTDAIGVLKLVVGLSAPAPAWKYFDDAKLAASYKAAAALSPKGWSASAALTDPTTVPIDVKLIGVLTGDVDGNWAGS